MFQFAIPLPWWAIAALVAAVVALGWGAYARPLVPITRGQRFTLTGLRVFTLLFLLACLLRPVRVMPPAAGSDAVVPILVDVSRSMRLPDANGRSRIDVARDLLRNTLGPAFTGRFATETWTFGDTLARAHGDTMSADARGSDLSGALRAVRDRYRERRVAGIVVVSDGGDTGAKDASQSVDDAATPVYTVGIGSASLRPDIEVLDVAAGEAALTDSSVDLTVSAISRTSGTSPRSFQMRVLENGRSVDVRTVTPAGPDSPVRELFTVSPSRDTATLYTVEIPTAPGELVAENNRRSVLVSPPGRKRRVLVVEGAPGFEHTFIKRALASDPGIEVDSVVRKGRDERGNATYFVQAVASRAPRLATGFPSDREALFQYDAIVFANIQPDSLSRAQLELASEFVGERGGGILLLGAKSFAQHGLVGTPLEEVLPIELNDRGGGVVRTSSRPNASAYHVTLTPEGTSHPVMRVGSSLEDTAKRWAATPPLAGATALGAPRPGAQVLAVTSTADGVRPVIAVHRYGRGRAMVFAGEASWRWRMQLPSSDRTHEMFWRQTARWLASASPDPIAAAPMGNIIPGTTQLVGVDVRNAAFQPVRGAEVSMQVTLPGGEVREVKPTLLDAATGRFAAPVRFDQAGVYRIVTEARDAATRLGASDQWVLAGAADVEMADPRLNEDVLRRVSRASGGRYLQAADISRLPSLLAASTEPGPPRLQELWHNVWIFGAIIVLLGLEWFLRRQWGMR